MISLWNCPKPGKRKTERKNPNDLAKFVGKMAVTKDGEAAGIQYYSGNYGSFYKVNVIFLITLRRDSRFLSILSWRFALLVIT